MVKTSIRDRFSEKPCLISVPEGNSSHEFEHGVSDCTIFLTEISIQMSMSTKMYRYSTYIYIFLLSLIVASAAAMLSSLNSKSCGNVISPRHNLCQWCDRKMTLAWIDTN